jgi:hypothetical protein
MHSETQGVSRLGVRYASVMRRTLVLATLLYGAVSADAAAPAKKWCSDGSGYLVLSDEVLTMTANGKTELFEYAGPTNDKTGAVFVATSGPKQNENYIFKEKIGETDAVIFRDRVFWPCEEQ